VKYRRVEAIHGDTVIMPCNASPSSDVMWIQNRTDGKLNRVNYHNIKLLFSVVNASAGDYSLKIYKVHPVYSGLYDCYDSNRCRIIEYHLAVKGVFL